MTTSAIFDAPGPKTRKLIATITTVSIILILIVVGLAVRQFYISGQLAGDKWDTFATWPTWRYLLGALGKTLLAAAGAAAIALPLGLVLALGRLNPFWPLKAVAVVLIEMFRAIPLLLIIYVFFIALPQYGLNPDLFWKLVIPIALCAGATIAEVFRAGVLALPSGQTEAGKVIGLRSGQIFRIIVFPQAVRMVVPSLVAQLVILLKDTTLGYVVSYGELQHSAKVLIASTGDLIQTYLIVTVIYILINVSISKFAEFLQNRSKLRRRPVASQIQEIA